MDTNPQFSYIDQKYPTESRWSLKNPYTQTFSCKQPVSSSKQNVLRIKEAFTLEIGKATLQRRIMSFAKRVKINYCIVLEYHKL